MREVLNQEEVLISDESLLWDFSDWLGYDIEDALRPGTRPGYFVFKEKKFYRGRGALDDMHKKRDEPKEIEALPTGHFRKEIIDRTLEVFGVDISSVFDKYLPEVFQFISARLPTEKRATLFRR